jgi:hypothetical protein
LDNIYRLLDSDPDLALGAGEQTDEPKVDTGLVVTPSTGDDCISALGVRDNRREFAGITYNGVAALIIVAFYAVIAAAIAKAVAPK